MSFFTIFWSALIVFSFIVFMLMSVMILVKGIGEIKEMFHGLQDKYENIQLRCLQRPDPEIWCIPP